MDTELSGDEETFVATVTFDTQELFGKVATTREIKVQKSAVKEVKKKAKSDKKAD